jgi:hypothetical protein
MAFGLQQDGYKSAVLPKRGQKSLVGWVAILLAPRLGEAFSIASAGIGRWQSIGDCRFAVLRLFFEKSDNN